MNKPYACGDEDCLRRESDGTRCPWCWGGFPSTMPEPTGLAAVAARIEADALRPPEAFYTVEHTQQHGPMEDPA